MPIWQYWHGLKFLFVTLVSAFFKKRGAARDLNMVEFEIGDLVWAKMKGFSPWPAKVVEPLKTLNITPLKTKEKQYFVRFFGTNDHSWILASNILTYEDGKEKFGDKGTGSFKKAVQEMYAYAEKNPPVPKKKAPVLTIAPKEDKVITPKSTTPKENGVRVSKGSSNKKLSLLKEKSTKSTSGSAKRVNKKENAGAKKRRISSESNDLNSSYLHERNGHQFKMLATMESDNYRPSYNRSHNYDLFKSSYDRVDGHHPTPETKYETHRLKEMDIPATDTKIGFIGLGNMGLPIVRHLIQTGHNLVIWNRSKEKCYDFCKNAKIAAEPEDVVKEASIIFSCLSDSDVAKHVFYGSRGILQGMENGKSYVEMTSIEPSLSHAFNEAVNLKRGRYLEVCMLGSRKEAENGNLLLLAAGNQELFKECHSCFRAMGETIYFLGGVGKAIKMSLIVNTVTGSCFSAVAEAMALADRCDIALKDVVDIFQCGDLQCPAIIKHGHAIAEYQSVHKLVNNIPLQHIQRKLFTTLEVGEKCLQPLPTTAASHEVLKHAKRKGYGKNDVAIIFKTNRFH